MINILTGSIAYVLMAVFISAAQWMEVRAADGLRVAGMFAGIAAFIIGVCEIRRYLDGYNS